MRAPGAAQSWLVLIYIAALAGAFLGAKLVYLGAEGWLHWHDPNRWLILATGKSITGALLGGYAAVEIAKRLLGYTRRDRRLVCRHRAGGHHARPNRLPAAWLLSGARVRLRAGTRSMTSDGVARWPAVPVELLFNALMLGVVWGLRRRKILPGQHFHIYLMAYGVFRFFHEFLRDTPRILGPISGYQVAALAVAVLGAAGFISRRRQTNWPEPSIPVAAIQKEPI